VNVPSPAPAREGEVLLVEDGVGQERATERALHPGEVWPRVWSSGSYGEGYGPENLTDGNTNTCWVGDIGGAPWWIGLDLGGPLNLDKFQMEFAEKLWKYTGIVGSADGVQWYDVLTQTNVPFSCRYIMIQLWADPGRGDLPVVREIEWGVGE
jgi:hypothetical protein